MRHTQSSAIDVVVKVGGGLLAHGAAFDAVLAAIAAARARLLVVPGGGPFADAVRTVDRERQLPDTTAHWMAILAMDQYAHLLGAVLRGARVVRSMPEIAAAQASGQVPVLAPFDWLFAVDPLAHSWDVTSDSVAAWLAGAVGASRLVIVKPPHARGDLLDPWFPRTLPASVTPVVVTGDALDELAAAMVGV